MDMETSMYPPVKLHARVRDGRGRGEEADAPELVPRLEHSRAEVEVVERLFGEGDDELAVCGRDSVGVVPLEILSGPVVERQRRGSKRIRQGLTSSEG
jgi:hypothetical protein